MPKFLTCFVGMIVLFGIVPSSMGDRRIKVESLARAVLSKSCRERSRAVESLIKSSGKVSLKSLRTDLMKVSPHAATYLKDAFDFLESIRAASETTEQLIKSRITEVSQRAANKRDTRGIPETDTVEVLAKSLLKDIASAKTPEEQALIVGYLAQRAVHYYPDQEATPYLNALDQLLSGQQLRLSLFAASVLAMSDTHMKINERLIPILLAGLMSNEFSMRYYAQRSLKLLTKQNICYNPLDPPNDRGAAIDSWKHWWEKAH